MTSTYIKPASAVRPERSELLMPAGDLHRLKTAILYGADAVYCGTPDLSLRTKSGMTLDDLVEGIEFAHARGKNVYLTLNLFTHNKDFEKLPQMIETVRKVKPDGVIIADPAVFQYVKENAPELELHISTQANICSWMSVKFWEDQGASLAVLAREVSFPELKEIREKCPSIKLEAFVHGAMCMTYSGRCLLSNFMAERGANQGNCAQSCRWKYKVKAKLKDGKTKDIEINDSNKDMFEFMLEEDYRPGEFMEIQEDDRGSYILNSKDLCLMPVLNEYLELGVDSLKVEGRHKNAYYASVVARTYRKAIDDYYADPQNWKPDSYMRELQTVRNRGYTLAFHEGRLKNHAHDYDTTASLGDWSFGGFIREWDGDDMIFEMRNAMASGDVLEFLPPISEYHNGLDAIRIRLYEFTCAKTGKILEKVSAGQGNAIRISSNDFHSEDLATIKQVLQPFTVARCETPDYQEEKQERAKLRVKSHQAEYGKITIDHYEGYKEENLDKTLVNESVKAGKAPKQGEKGCCGRGCNGCMIFWNDPQYAKARELLKEKKQGLKLDKNTRDDLIVKRA